MSVHPSRVSATNQIDVAFKHPEGKRYGASLRKTARKHLKLLGLKATELSVSLVTDQQIQALNFRWRQQDKPTDVLSFPSGSDQGHSITGLLGDVVISLDTARRCAHSEKRAVEDEVARYLAHGILHLLGHDHQTRKEAREMANWEEKLLGQKGMI